VWQSLMWNMLYQVKNHMNSRLIPVKFDHLHRYWKTDTLLVLLLLQFIISLSIDIPRERKIYKYMKDKFLSFHPYSRLYSSCAENNFLKQM